MKKIKYIYISSLVFSPTVYQTQVIDWLHLYAENGVDFELVHQFYINPKNIKFHRDQKRQIKNTFHGNVRFLYVHHNYPIFRWINKLITLCFFLKDILCNDKIVFFSRANIGHEMAFMKKLIGSKIVYYYDLRAATVDEAVQVMKAKGTFSKNRYKRIADIAYGEYLRLMTADKVFCVSNALKKYNVEEYHADESKFVSYPCLSMHSKFFYDENLRERKRVELGYTKEDNVYVYSGGVANVWTVPDSFLRLFFRVAEQDQHAKMLVLTFKATKALYDTIASDPLLKERVQVYEGIPNEKIVDFLNAADFGILLRQNCVLNNVASPSKYAEYMLCGLPTIISESIHDFANYCRVHKTGILFSNYDFEHMDEVEIKPLSKDMFNRKSIADVAVVELSKESAAKRLVKELKIY